MHLLERPFLDDRAQVRTPHSHRTPTLDAIPGCDDRLFSGVLALMSFALRDRR